MHYPIFVFVPSHFEFDIISDVEGWVEVQMAPYNENAPDAAPTEFKDCTDDLAKRFNDGNDTVRRVRAPDGKILGTADPNVPYLGSDDESSDFVVPGGRPLAEGYEYVSLTLQEAYGSVEGVAKAWRYDMHEGRFGYWYNPNGHWDWWQIGGCWTGALDGYDPYKDPKNRTTCILCHGTGRRDDELGKKAREVDPSYTCNGCGGEGISSKWPTSFSLHEGDIQPASVAAKAEFVPHHYIDENKVWHSCGMFPDDKDTVEKFERNLREKLSSFDGHVVIVDCHI